MMESKYTRRSRTRRGFTRPPLYANWQRRWISRRDFGGVLQRPESGHEAFDWREATRIEARLQDVSISELLSGHLSAEKEARRVRGRKARSEKLRQARRRRRVLLRIVNVVILCALLFGGIVLHSADRPIGAVIVWTIGAVILAAQLAPPLEGRVKS